MLLRTSPTAIYVKSERDLSHIELTRSGNISSLSGWGSPKRRMSFGGSQRSESISSGRSPHIDKRKRARIEGFFSFTLALFCLYIGLGLAHLHLSGQMRCSHLTVFFKFSAKSITHLLARFFALCII